MGYAPLQKMRELTSTTDHGSVVDREHMRPALVACRAAAAATISHMIRLIATLCRGLIVLSAMPVVLLLATSMALRSLCRWLFLHAEYDGNRAARDKAEWRGR